MLLQTASRSGPTSDAPDWVAPIHSTPDPAVDLDSLRSVVDRRLDLLVALPATPTPLDEAIRYSLLTPGKRIRPLLTILTAWQFGDRDLRALDAGCALEMIHAASLIYDDLPAMDDDATRRGKPATHVRFGVDIALLAAVSLIGRAFATAVGARDLTCDMRCRVVTILADAIGSAGLSAGQLADLREAGSGPDKTRIDDLKTGVLFVAATEMAAVITEVGAHELADLRDFAGRFGRAFQAKDDLDDGAPRGCRDLPGDPSIASSLADCLAASRRYPLIAPVLDQAFAPVAKVTAGRLPSTTACPT